MDMTKVRRAAYLGFALTHDGPWVTSGEISKALAINSTQIRRDLGGLDVGGRRGVGYDRERLISSLTEAVLHDDSGETLVSLGLIAQYANAGREYLEHTRP